MSCADENIKARNGSPPVPEENPLLAGAANLPAETDDGGLLGRNGETGLPEPTDMSEWKGTPADIRAKPKDEYIPTTDAPSYTSKAIDINAIIDLHRDFYPEDPYDSGELIRQAYTFAAMAHSGTDRLSGEPYLSHPLAVANILANLKLDAITIAAGLLHDTVEDTTATLDQIKETFGKHGPDLRRIIDGVTKIGKTNFSSKTERRAANLSKMVLASMKDMRILFVKLADRLHNMRTLSFMKQAKREEISQETLDFYAPFATKLGIHKIKTELEDLSLFNLHPEDYTNITKKLSSGKARREEYVDKVKKVLSKRLDEFGIAGEVDGRNKHIYSIWRKMNLQNLPFDQIYDLFAFRIILNSVEDCYKVLGVVHTHFTPLPGRFKDYINLPKPNGYRSLHTAVVGPDNIHVEIQIRTAEMHSQSEDGVAAHWRYKVGGNIAPEEQKLISKLRETIYQVLTGSTANTVEFLDDLKDYLENRDIIYVFTPPGDLIDLPTGSTPIDFA
ncbi:MAG: RelA/SpoT family protein, partial [Deltaproteobacteria bacterium]|nr:RelA/SpoT family protein [Deltaproteobacteria bacterium]